MVEDTGKDWSSSELVISAEGQLQLFSKVLGLCKVCPRKLLLETGWTIQPFKQRMPIEDEEVTVV